MPTLLYYDGNQILSNQPTPFVERQDNMVRYGERWCDQTLITLNGQITGCIKNPQSLILAQQELIQIFSKDFQEFKIVEDGKLIYTKPFSIIKGGIDFPTSNYVGILNYKVTLECYHENLFSGYFGVLEPINTWSYEEQEDRRLVITHNISARGFNTSSGATNALINAKNFVQSKTGISSINYPTFILLPSGAYPCLKQVKEKINRMNASYGLELRYEADLYHNLPGILRYTTDFECDVLNGKATVSVNGQLESCFDSDLTSLRARYSLFNPYSVALDTYQEATSNTDLNLGYLSSGVIENPYKNTLSFNIQFDNFVGDNVFLDYSVGINSGDNDITTVSFDGTISARGSAANKWTRVSGYYTSGINIFGLSNAEYIAFGGTDPLNPIPLTSGVTFNSFIGEISTNASWNNKTPPIDDFSDFNYSISYTPAIQKTIAKPLATNLSGPICVDRYAVFDLRYKSRCNFNVNGNGKIACGKSMSSAIDNLKVFANQLFNSGCPQNRVLLEENRITTGTNTVSFSFSWTAESSFNVINPPIYNTINELKLL